MMISQGAKDIVVGFGILGALAVAGFLIVQRLGIFSYMGLTPQQVMAVYHEMDKRCQILSRVQGVNRFTGKRFIRGIYLGGAANFPLYYHYNFSPDGRSADFSIYPVLWSEKWGTDSDLLGFSGKLIYP